MLLVMRVLSLISEDKAVLGQKQLYKMAELINTRVAVSPPFNAIFFATSKLKL